MWNLISVHLEIVLVSVQDRCMVWAKRTIGSEIVWTHPMVLIGDVGHVNLISVCLETLLVSNAR